VHQAVSKKQPKSPKLDIPFHSKSLYSVEKTIVGISQYAYFRYWHLRRGEGVILTKKKSLPIDLLIVCIFR
jgi:hypothetical protein